MPKMTHSNGTVVDVPEEKVSGLLARGFTRAEKPAAKATKATAKSAAKK